MFKKTQFAMASAKGKDSKMGFRLKTQAQDSFKSLRMTVDSDCRPSKYVDEIKTADVIVVPKEHIDPKDESVVDLSSQKSSATLTSVTNSLSEAINICMHSGKSEAVIVMKQGTYNDPLKTDIDLKEAPFNFKLLIVGLGQVKLVFKESNFKVTYESETKSTSKGTIFLKNLLVYHRTKLDGVVLALTNIYLKVIDVKFSCPSSTAIGGEWSKIKLVRCKFYACENAFGFSSSHVEIINCKFIETKSATGGVLYNSVIIVLDSEFKKSGFLKVGLGSVGVTDNCTFHGDFISLESVDDQIVRSIAILASRESVMLVFNCNFNCFYAAVQSENSHSYVQLDKCTISNCYFSCVAITNSSLNLEDCNLDSVGLLLYLENVDSFLVFKNVSLKDPNSLLIFTDQISTLENLSHDFVEEPKVFRGPPVGQLENIPSGKQQAKYTKYVKTLKEQGCEGDFTSTPYYKRCNRCFNPEGSVKYKFCGNCKKISYCSKSCQKRIGPIIN